MCILSAIFKCMKVSSHVSRIGHRDRLNRQIRSTPFRKTASPFLPLLQYPLFGSVERGKSKFNSAVICESISLRRVWRRIDSRIDTFGGEKRPSFEEIKEDAWALSSRISWIRRVFEQCGEHFPFSRDSSISSTATIQGKVEESKAFRLIHPRISNR